MTLERLFVGEKEILLIGTAHISAESVRLAQETILTEKPDVVGIELDEQRYHQLKNDSKWQSTDIGAVIKEGKTYLLLLNIFLSNLQRRLGESVSMKPGQEMIIAEQTATQNGIPVALLDRNIQVTMQRAFGLMPLMEKLRLGYYLLMGIFGGGTGEKITPEKIEELKRQDIVTNLIQELGQKAPTVKQVLVDERDQFIAKRILDTPAKKIVCVIGAGHVAGIKKILQNPVFIDEKKLMELPKKNNTWSFLKWVIPLAFVALMAWFFLEKGLVSSIHAIAYWILITGMFSAIGAAFAKSHPLTIATAFLAAPLTTLHPFLASGWIAGGIEAKYNTPQVRDFQSLNQLNSYSDFEKNRVTHLLIVASYTNLGSTLGVLIAFPYLLSSLA
ncbi:MAG: TraB/GumN family protein [Candidatus Diapherotrites archaeon]|uniref:TraB/GumN family protein n=1 Tax=Candidatus Iainarchaeum sp. TaxID=3101447 RepID=A0A8T4LGI0_9ARCH|nr:TraB/GumN family protein [Candidatus Diapherotrites archaeon]